MNLRLLTNVEIWWYALCGISAFNIGIWFLSYRLLLRNSNKYFAETYKGRTIVVWLSFVYVLVCAFRSFLPRIDLERICLVDHWLSSVLLGRTLTTFAEICFIAQCALILYEAGKNTNNRFTVNVSYILIPVIIIAEGFSWYATITTNYLANVFEESLWAISGFLLITGFAALWRDADKIQRLFVSTVILFGIGYLVFMTIVDIPMYWYRFVLDSASGKSYLPLWQGIQDAACNYRVSFDWQIWRNETPWMTLYFSVAVWMSIYLPHSIVFSKNKELP
jgi:hypothetical protein